MASNCEECVHYDYDDEMDVWYCTMDLDEDEMERFLRSANDACPFYRRETITPPPAVSEEEPWNW